MLDWLNVLPHAVMGAVAGHLGKHYANPIPAFSIVVGHGLNVVAFIVAGVWSLDALPVADTLVQIGREVLAGVVVITVVVNTCHLVARARAPRTEGGRASGERGASRAEARDRSDRKRAPSEPTLPISTERRVWIVLCGLTLALTVLFGLCLYFTSLFLTFVAGALLLALGGSSSRTCCSASRGRAVASS